MNHVGPSAQHVVRYALSLCCSFPQNVKPIALDGRPSIYMKHAVKIAVLYVYAWCRLSSLSSSTVMNIMSQSCSLSLVNETVRHNVSRLGLGSKYWIVYIHPSGLALCIIETSTLSLQPVLPAHIRRSCIYMFFFQRSVRTYELLLLSTTRCRGSLCLLAIGHIIIYLVLVPEPLSSSVGDTRH